MTNISMKRLAMTGLMLAATAIPTGSFAQVKEQAMARSDGGSISLTGTNARIAGKDGALWIRQINANLPNQLQSYNLSEIEAAVEKANGAVASANAQRLTVTVCWNGKKRRWCVSVSGSTI